MISIAIALLIGILSSYILNKIGLPGILGMILTGIILGPEVIDVFDKTTLIALREFKSVALIIILIRAGLGIHKSTLKRIGPPAIMLGFIPCLLEGATISIIALYVLDFSIYEAGMLGFIIAAVSPAVVVPSMLELKDKGLGKTKEIPTLILAGASLDDVIAITIFSVFAGIGAGQGANWTYVILGVPAGIVLGAVGGLVIGVSLIILFKAIKLRDSLKAIIIVVCAILFHHIGDLKEITNLLPIATLLGVMAIGFVILEKREKTAINLSRKFGSIWSLAELLLFIYIGTEVKFSVINGKLLGIALGVLAFGLCARSVGVWFSLIKTDLNNKEKFFCIISYLPKATVQAAMGAVPLGLILDGSIAGSSIQIGQTILTFAVLSIIVTAPIGAIGIKSFGPSLLAEEK